MDVIFDHFTDSDLLRAFVLRVLRDYQSKMGAILREFHLREHDSIQD